MGWLLLACLWGAPAHAQSTLDDAAVNETPAPAVPMNPGRLEFDERLVRGERAAGAVYLFQRRPRNLPGLVPMRRSFRSRIVEPVLADRPILPPPEDASAE